VRGEICMGGGGGRGLCVCIGNGKDSRAAPTLVSKETYSSVKRDLL
jgi:hypothetical protein